MLKKMEIPDHLAEDVEELIEEDKNNQREGAWVTVALTALGLFVLSISVATGKTKPFAPGIIITAVGCFMIWAMILNTGSAKNFVKLLLKGNKENECR